ncbi:MAG: ArnT family glycosyltransferase, partial [Acidimicrobiales bacterium]
MMRLLRTPGGVVVAVLGLVGIAVIGGSIAVVEAVVAFIAPALLGVVGLVVLIRHVISQDDPALQRRVLRWTLAAFGAHLVVGAIVIGVDTPLFSALRGDEAAYHGIAKEILRHWEDGFPMPRVPPGREGFYYVVAALYRVFGPYKVAALAYNATVAAAIVPLITEITARLFGKPACRYATILASVMPGLFLWTSLPLKEATVLFLICVAALGGVRMADRITFTAFAVLTLPLAMLLTFRGYVGFVFALTLVIGVMLSRRQLLTGVSTAVGALALLSVLVFTVGLGYSGYRSTTDADLRDANIARQDLATSAASGFHTNVDISSPKRALTYLPAGVVNFAFGPYPWQVRGLRQLPALPDVLAIFLLLPALCRGIATGWRRQGRRVLLLLLPASTLAMLLALVIGNYGTLVRERCQVVVLLLPFAALGLAERRTFRSDSTTLGDHAPPT